VVINHLKKGPPASQFSLKEVSKRLVTLLALCNASRASDIKALDSRFKVFTDGGVKFTIPGLTKTLRSGPPKEVFFVEFKECECLCPVKTVKVYLDKTDPLRNGNSQLVISYRRPHGPVSSATISRWIKENLADAGVDTDVFKAHSTRSASTSAA